MIGAYCKFTILLSSMRIPTLCNNWYQTMKKNWPGVCVAGSEPVANLQFYYPVYGLPPYITLLPDHEKELARFYMILTIQYADCQLLLQLLPVHE